jgi:uncharacterized protein (TIGR02145 family)
MKSTPLQPQKATLLCTKHFLLTMIMSVLFVFTTCVPKMDNPWDSNGTLDPKAWAPTNIALQDMSVTSKKLTWEYSGDNRIEGFKIDRKQGNGNWQIGYMAVSKEVREAVDVEVTPDTTLTHTYRIYTIAGQNSSATVTLETNPVFPAPTTISAEIQSLTRVIIRWQYPSSGHTGFTIARKVNEGEWQTNFATTASNKLEFTDSTVNFSTNHYIYSVKARYNNYGSNLISIITGKPTVTTNEITNIAATDATTGGNVTFDGGATVTARGVCYATTENPTTANSMVTSGTGTGIFAANLSGLTPATTYYVRAYATNSAGTSYGEQRTFTTMARVPTVTTTDISEITTTSATSGGNVTSDGGATITARGVCYAISANPITADSTVASGTGTGSFTVNLTNLAPGTVYYVRAYATNSAGTSYGEQRTFTTTVGAPTVITTVISNITATSATTGGNVTSNGGNIVSARGVCYATTQNPTTSSSTIPSGSGTGSFIINLNGLTPATTYYVRAYATNSAGTSYGEQRTFTTTAQAPSVTTTAISNITDSGATSGGNVTADGGTTVTARGVCYATTQNPTTTNSTVASGSGTGIFTSNLTNLAPETVYYVRAYATNSAGTSYGEQHTFTTVAGAPTVTTTVISNITATAATTGGNVTADGGATVTARGVCYATTENPTTADNTVASGGGTGSFDANLSGLASVTTYYVRAYATNIAGTSYGEQRTFTTTEGVMDADGNIYNTITIGTQTWMKENLKTTKYNDGSNIPIETSTSAWAGLSTPAYCWYNNDIANKPIYGALYNWYVVNTGNLCPTGWHVPTDAEWYAMENYVDPTINDPEAIGYRGTDGAVKLKATSGWDSPGNGTDNYGFSALPGGRRSSSGVFLNGGGYAGYLWSSNQSAATTGLARSLVYNSTKVYRGDGSKESGFSVRCVRD